MGTRTSGKDSGVGDGVLPQRPRGHGGVPALPEDGGPDSHHAEPCARPHVQQRAVRRGVSASSSAPRAWYSRRAARGRDSPGGTPARSAPAGDGLFRCLSRSAASERCESSDGREPARWEPAASASRNVSHSSADRVPPGLVLGHLACPDLGPIQRGAVVRDTSRWKGAQGLDDLLSPSPRPGAPRALRLASPGGSTARTSVHAARHGPTSASEACLAAAPAPSSRTPSSRAPHTSGRDVSSSASTTRPRRDQRGGRCAGGRTPREASALRPGEQRAHPLAPGAPPIPWHCPGRARAPSSRSCLIWPPSCSRWK